MTKEQEAVLNMTEEQENDLREIIDLGHELEAIEFNKKFIGYDGITSKTINRERTKARHKMIVRIDRLSKQGLEVLWLKDYSYTDENGIEWELDYALQFL